MPVYLNFFAVVGMQAQIDVRGTTMVTGRRCFVMDWICILLRDACMRIFGLGTVAWRAFSTSSDLSELPVGCRGKLAV